MREITKGERLESPGANALFALKRVGKCTCSDSHYVAGLRLHVDEKQAVYAPISSFGGRPLMSNPSPLLAICKPPTTPVLARRG